MRVTYVPVENMPADLPVLQVITGDEITMYVRSDLSPRQLCPAINAVLDGYLRGVRLELVG